MSQTPITVLGIETSCDETAAAIVRLTPDTGRASGMRGDILSNVVLSQIDLHAPYGGVVPELAARAHIDHLDRMVAEALAESRMQAGRHGRDCRHRRAGADWRRAHRSDDGQGAGAGKRRTVYGINHLEGHALTARLTHDVAFHICYCWFRRALPAMSGRRCGGLHACRHHAR